MRTFLIGLIRGYQLLIGPLMGAHCRYYPSCSQYTIEAVRRHGASYGSYLAGCRLLRCHPWHTGGFDPVPPPASIDDP